MSAQHNNITGSGDHDRSSKEAVIAARILEKSEGETTGVEIPKYEEVAMRNVIHPSRESGQNIEEGNDDDNDKGDERDVADGVDIFSKEAFEPLLTSNQYQVRKLAAQALMDVALMMANISQLRTLVSLGVERAQQFYVLVALVSFSLTCQLVFAVFMFVILMRESSHEQKKDFIDNLRKMQKRGMSSVTTANIRESVNQMQEFKHQVVTSYLNYFTMVLVFLITVTNMFITGFGIKHNDD